MRLVIIVGCVLVGVVLLAPMFLARRRAPQERGLTPVFEAVCSGSTGWGLGGNIPMFRLSIYSHFFVVGFLTPYVTPYGELTRVEVKSGILGRRLCIWTKGGASFQLSVSEPEKVAQLLRHP
jgi:hypothetical protein